jgi:DNA processing protein
MTHQKDGKKYQIALSLIDGVGDIVGKKLLAQFGSAKGVFFAKRKELQKIHGIGSILLTQLLKD